MAMRDETRSGKHAVHENRDMPQRVSVESEFSDEALRFHDAITSKSRLVILRCIAKEPGITVPELEERLELSLPMIYNSLKHLRELGYVKNVKSPNDARVQQLYINRQQLGADFARLFLAILD